MMTQNTTQHPGTTPSPNPGHEAAPPQPPPQMPRPEVPAGNPPREFPGKPDRDVPQADRERA